MKCHLLEMAADFDVDRGYMATALLWLFENPENVGWVQASGTMQGRMRLRWLKKSKGFILIEKRKQRSDWRKYTIHFTEISEIYRNTAGRQWLCMGADVSCPGLHLLYHLSGASEGLL